MNSSEAKRIRLLPDTANPGEASRILTQPGDASFVVRGMVRSLVLRCPCGCGDDYIINLDSRAGPAWRHYRRKGTLSLYPSYWREGGCGSHFIINRSEIWWCRFDEEWGLDIDDSLLEKVRTTAPEGTAFAAHELAHRIDEIPWEVRAACERLVRKNELERVGRGIDTLYRRKTQ